MDLHFSKILSSHAMKKELDVAKINSDHTKKLKTDKKQQFWSTTPDSSGLFILPSEASCLLPGWVETLV